MNASKTELVVFYLCQRSEGRKACKTLGCDSQPGVHVWQACKDGKVQGKEVEYHC